MGKKIVAAEAISVERLIRDGPPDGDIAGALESTRLKILDQGIKSDGDGMVDFPAPSKRNTVLMLSSLLFGYTYGSFSSMLLSSRPTCIYHSYIEEHHPHTPRFVTTLFER